MGKQALQSKLRELLRDGMVARHEGGLHAEKVRRQAYADGFARALCDAGLVSREELQAIVLEERAGLDDAAPLAAVG